MTSLGDAWVSIKADGRNFGVQVDRLVKSASGKDVTVGVTLKDAAAKLGFADLRAQRDDLNRKAASIHVDANDKAAVIKLARLAAKMDALNRKRIDPDISLRGAAATLGQIHAIGVALDKLGRKTARPDVSPGGGKLGALGGASPLLAGGLALAPGIAVLAGAATAAVAGLGGAFLAATGAVGAFGAVAKPVLSDAQKAAQAVETAQNAHAAAVAKVVGQYKYAMSVATTNAQRAKAYAAEQKALNNAQLNQAKAVSLAYAELSPQQIALSKQLGDMAQAWQGLKAAETPVVAGALQPWLKSVTDLTGKLAPVIAAVSPPIALIGTEIDALVNSSVFNTFRDWIAGTGSAAVGAAGNAVTGLLDALVVLLPKFTPLIDQAIRGLSGFGDSVAHWANSQQAADAITKFMAWFSNNGPAVGTLLKNLGSALGALLPGLTSGGQLEIKVISDFLGFIGKLPKGIAGPLAEVAGAALVLSKLPGGTKLINYVVSGSLGGIFKGSGGGAGAAEAAGAGAAGTGLWSKLLPGARLAAGGLIVGVLLSFAGSLVPKPPKSKQLAADRETGAPQGGLVIKADDFLHLTNLAGWIDKVLSHPIRAWFENTLPHISAAGWDIVFSNTIGRTARGFHDVAGAFDTGRHIIAAKWDALRHDAASAWDTTWANTAGRAQRGFHDVASLFDSGRHQTASVLSGIRSDAGSIWNTLWSNTAGRIQRGFHDTASLFDQGRHSTASVLSGIRSDAASIWGRIWSDTGNAVRNGVHAVEQFIGGLPGAIKHFFSAAGTWLFTGGSNVISGLFSGLKSTWTTVSSWFAGLPHAILHALGIASPPKWSIDAGRHIMGGLLKGIAHGASDVKGFFTGLATSITGPLGNVWSGLLASGADVGRFITGLLGLGGSGGGTGLSGAGSAIYAADIASVLKSMGLPLSLVGNWLRQIQTESGGSLTAVNRTDSNARAGHPSVGLLQLIPSTFAAYAGPFRNAPPVVNEGGGPVSENPLAQIYAAVHYAAARYGGAAMAGVIGHGHGYALGTLDAMPGWAWVGERGPELMHFRGHEQVRPVQAVAGVAPVAHDNHGPVLHALLSEIRGLRHDVRATPIGFGAALSGSVRSASSRGYYGAR